MMKMIFLLCLVSGSIIAQKINPDTLNIDQLNLYKDKAVKLRNAGIIVTFTGVGSAAAGCISSAIWAGNFKGESGEGFITLAPLLFGMAVLIPATIIGIPLWSVGGSRKAKAELTLKKFDIKPDNSMTLGVGITLRF